MQRKCVWNKAFLLGTTYLFTLQRHYLHLFIEKIDKKKTTNGFQQFVVREVFGRISFHFGHTRYSSGLHDFQPHGINCLN